MKLSPPKFMKIRSLVLATGLFLTVSQASASVVSGDFVGEVTLVVLKAWVEHPGGSRERLEHGMRIRVGDTIRTENSAIVHVRFADDALVAVRANSRLEIVRYDYNPTHPENSFIKLNLEEGVTRAVSGEAAKKARQNFRMNTPIAAIGVRGTDFVVSANQDSVRALVNEGTIVVAPFSAECSAAAFGPCQDNALELTGATNQIVEVRANTVSPVFLPADGRQPALPDELPAQTQVAAAPRQSKESDEAPVDDPYVASVTTRAVTQKLQVTTAPSEPQQPPVVPPVVEQPPLVEQPPVVPPIVDVPPGVDPPIVQPPIVEPPIEVPPIQIADLTPPTPVPVPQLQTSQLLWGRWAVGESANDRITVSYAVATADGRKSTIRNDRYALYRIENGPPVVKYGLGVVDFTLNAAQATFTPLGGSASLMNVEGGRLSIDFRQERFSTSLDLSHAATGDLTFSDSGGIHPGGYFYSRNPGQTMAGAVSLDGAEAGYVFDKTLPNGYVEGLTLWGRQP